jgi:hypothetical protein
MLCLFVLNERMREKNARCLVFLLIIQFVLSFCHFFFHKAMELCYLFSLIILVIYDGGRHPIEIARTLSLAFFLFYSLVCARSLVGLDKTNIYIRCMTTTVKRVITHKNDNWSLSSVSFNGLLFFSSSSFPEVKKCEHLSISDLFLFTHE